MVGKLFASKTRTDLLTLFFMNSGKEFYMRELSRGLDVNVNAVRRELKNLKELAIIKEKRKGNLILYTVNKNSPIYKELKGMVLKTSGLGEFLKERLEKMDLEFALVYGSFARGEETERSDVDILIVGRVDEDEFVKIINDFEKRIRREINYIIWSEKEFRRKAREKHHLLHEILKSPFIMLIGDENEFRRAAKSA